MTAPCRDCERREPGCHGSCPDYKGWREEMDRSMEARQKAREAEPMLCKQVVRQIYKSMRRR